MTLNFPGHPRCFRAEAEEEAGSGLRLRGLLELLCRSCVDQGTLSHAAGVRKWAGGGDPRLGREGAPCTALSSPGY